MSRNLIKRFSPILTRKYLSIYPLQRFSTTPSNNQVGSNYKVTEIKFKTNEYGGIIAGQLWESHKDANVKTPPPIISIHGWVDNSGSFTRLLPLLMNQPNRRILAFDLPGHGWSSHNHGNYYDSLMECHFIFNQIFREFKWSPVILFGHSLGSVISFVFTGLFPEKVAGYIGMDFLGPNPPDDFIRHHTTSINMLVKIANKEAISKEQPTFTYDEILERLYEGRMRAITIEGCKELLKRGSIEVAPGRFAWAHDQKTKVPLGWGLYRGRMVADLAKRIKCPSLYIRFFPGLQDFHEPLAKTVGIIEVIKQRNPDFHYKSVEGGHHAHLDNPERLEPPINQFLDKYF